MLGPKRRGIRTNHGPQPTRYLSKPSFGRWGYCGIHATPCDYPLGDGRYHHYRWGNRVLLRDYLY